LRLAALGLGRPGDDLPQAARAAAPARLRRERARALRPLGARSCHPEGGPATEGSALGLEQPPILRSTTRRSSQTSLKSQPPPGGSTKFLSFFECSQLYFWNHM